MAINRVGNVIAYMERMAQSSYNASQGYNTQTGSVRKAARIAKAAQKENITNKNKVKYMVASYNKIQYGKKIGVTKIGEKEKPVDRLLQKGNIIDLLA